MKDEVVYVRWYKEVVEGKVVNEHDLFGMVAVRIPIQGVQAIALFTPKDIYKTAQEACGTFPKHFHTPNEIVHLEPSVAVIPTSVNSGFPADADYQTIQQFKHDHWNHERNMLQLEYWPEFDRMYHAYQRKRTNTQPVCKVVSPPPKHTAVPVTSASVKPKHTVTVTELSLF